MIIYYPTYYLVPVVPVMFLDDGNYGDDISFRCSLDVREMQNPYRYRSIDENIHKDIFADCDEEYVNESTK